MSQLVPSPDFDSSIVRILELVRKGMECWLEAGAILVKLYDADPNNRERARRHFSRLPAGVQSTLERLGRKQLAYEVYAGAGVGFRELSRMPYDIQVKHVTEPVELLVLDNNGKADVLKVAVKDLSRDQARQVFGRQEPRDLAAQRAYLADLNRQKVPLRIEDNFRVSKDKVVILKPCELTRQQLASILAQMG